jgi:hypothetical protein
MSTIILDSQPRVNAGGLDKQVGREVILVGAVVSSAGNELHLNASVRAAAARLREGFLARHLEAPQLRLAAGRAPPPRRAPPLLTPPHPPHRLFSRSPHRTNSRCACCCPRTCSFPRASSWR